MSDLSIPWDAQGDRDTTYSIIISLRNDMFELSHRLVGIYKTSNVGVIEAWRQESSNAGITLCSAPRALRSTTRIYGCRASRESRVPRLPAGQLLHHPAGPVRRWSRHSEMRVCLSFFQQTCPAPSPSLGAVVCLCHSRCLVDCPECPVWPCCIGPFPPRPSFYAQTRGSRSTSSSSSSRVPDPLAPISDMYSHRAVSGRLCRLASAPCHSPLPSPTHLIRMLSMRAPGVISPNLVPRSCTRLNST